MLLRSRNVRIMKWKIWEHLEILCGSIKFVSQAVIHDFRLVSWEFECFGLMRCGISFVFRQLIKVRCVSSQFWDLLMGVASTHHGSYFSLRVCTVRKGDTSLVVFRSGNRIVSTWSIEYDGQIIFLLRLDNGMATACDSDFVIVDRVYRGWSDV